MSLLAAHLHRLVCPVCHAALALTETAPQTTISCTGCGRQYPIVDGLPVLIASRAILAPEKY
jgi:uncharacterized protein YbaR (Trm112 family)